MVIEHVLVLQIRQPEFDPQKLRWKKHSRKMFFNSTCTPWYMHTMTHTHTQWHIHNMAHAHHDTYTTCTCTHSTCTPWFIPTMTHAHYGTCTPKHMYTTAHAHHDTCIQRHMHTMTHSYNGTCTPRHMHTMAHAQPFQHMYYTYHDSKKYLWKQLDLKLSSPRL